jgi:hypothetical protein
MNTLALEEAYRETFGISAEELAQQYDAVKPGRWQPVTHYRFAHDQAAEGVQNAILFSGFEHSYDPSDPLFHQTLRASQYVVKHTDMERLSVHVEGRVRHPPEAATDQRVFSTLGELALFEAILRKNGLPDYRLRSPEPSKKVVHEFDDEYGMLYTLAYFSLRKLPQLIDGTHMPSYPYTLLTLTANEYVEVFDHQSGSPRVDIGSVIQEIWNQDHPPEFHIVVGKPLSRETTEAIRNETTLISCLKVPPSKRNVIQSLAVAFNMRRHLEFAACLDQDILLAMDTAGGFGRTHHMILDWRLKQKLASDPTATVHHPTL